MTKLYRSKDFTEKCLDFVTLKDCYEGNQKTMRDTKYLIPHELETKVPQGANIRKIREERSTYTNLCEPIVSMWLSFLFRNELTIPDSVKEILGDESLQNIDGRGSSFESFCRDHIAHDYILYGRTIVYPSAVGEAPVTKLQEGKSFKIVLKGIHPLSFVDYSRETTDPDNLNKLKFCRLEYNEILDRESPLSEVKEVVKSVALWLKDKKLYVQEFVFDDKEKSKKAVLDKCEDDRKWEPVTPEPLEFSDWDEIPIIAELDAESWLKDTVPHILKYYNTESVLDNICLYQAYQKTFVASDDMKAEDTIALAEYALSLLPADATITTVEPVNTESLERRLEKILNNIFRVALNQVRQTAGETRQVEAADTQKEQKDSMIALIQAEAEAIENIINESVRIYAKHLGKEAPADRVKLNISNDVTEADIVIRLVLAFKDELMKLPQMKQALMKWFAVQMNFDEKEELFDEIEQNIVQVSDATREGEQSIRSQLLRGINEPEAEAAQNNRGE